MRGGKLTGMKTLLSIHWIFLSMATWMMGFLFPLYLNSVGFSEIQLGNVFIIGTALSTVVFITLFVHSDLIGRKFYLVVFGLFVVLSSLIAAALPPFFFLALFVILFYMATRRSPWTFGKIFAIEKFGREMGRSYGFFGASVTIGGSAGVFLAGAFVDSFGFGYSFLICSFIGLISLLPVAFLSGEKVKPQKFSFKPKFTKIFTGFIIHRFMYAVGLSSLLVFALPLYLKNELLLPYTLVGVVIAVQYIGSILGFLSGGLSDRHDFRRICYIGISLSGLLFLSAGLVGFLPLIILALFLAEFAHCIAASALPHFYKRVSTQLGRDISIVESVGITLGGSVGPGISGLMISFAGYPSVFAFGCIFLVGSALVLYALFR